MPDVPTMTEAGYKDFAFIETYIALLAPSRTPPEIVKWLETETLKILSTPEMKAKLFKAGFLVRPKGAAIAWTRIIKEMDVYKTIIEHAGIKKL